MTLLPDPPLSDAEARMLSPLQLAYIGDAVHSLMARRRALAKGLSAHDMHLCATRAVNAVSQSRVLTALNGLLTAEESDVVRRGRNAHARHTLPKAASQAEYASATGLEALLGYLYLTGKADRLTWIEQALFTEEHHA